MKSLHRIAALVAATLTLVGCGDFLAFPVEASVDEFVVPGDPYLHHDDAPLRDDVVPPVEVALDVPVGQGEISLIGLTLEVTPTAAPEGDVDDLEFVTTIDVYLTSTRPGTELPQLLVAHWDPTISPLENNRVELGVAGNENIAPYLAEGFRLDIRPHGVVPYDDVSMQGRVTFLVNPL